VRYVLDQIELDDDLYYGIQRILQRAIEHNEKKHRDLVNLWIEDVQIRGEHNKARWNQREGFNQAITFLAREFTIEEIYDLPDERS
jgi:hypothetical protein